MSKEEHTTIGIDASARSTGIVILSPETKPKEILIRPKKLFEGIRLEYIYDTLCDILAEKLPDLAVMEGASYYSTNKPFILGEVYGVCKLALKHYDIPLILVSPKALKKYAVNNGNANKEDLIEQANAQGCLSDKDDIADAWFASKLAQDILNGASEVKTRAAEEVVHRLKESFDAHQL